MPCSISSVSLVSRCNLIQPLSLLTTALLIPTDSIFNSTFLECAMRCHASATTCQYFRMTEQTTCMMGTSSKLASGLWPYQLTNTEAVDVMALDGLDGRLFLNNCFLFLNVYLNYGSSRGPPICVYLGHI